MQACRVILALLCGAMSFTAEAHGFAQRYDLPVPLHLYVGGAAAAVAFSFVVIAFFVRGDRTVRHYPTFDLLSTAIGRILASRFVRFVLRFFTVFMLVLVVVAGLIGVTDPFKNIAPTAVWVVWWVGLAYISGLLGDLWALINPWKSVFEFVEWLFAKLLPDKRLGLHRNYPVRLGNWPAAVLFVCFIWAELIWTSSDMPASIAQMVISYSVITWTGMFVFGCRTWLRNAEIFTVVFGLLARFAPTEYIAERNEWNLRPWAVGLLPDKPMSTSLTVFVLLMLSSVTFDGLLATPLWGEIAQWMLVSDLVRPFILLLQGVTGNAIAAISTIALIVFLILFQLMYLVFAGLMYISTPATARKDLTIGEVARLRAEPDSDLACLSPRTLSVVPVDRRPVHDPALLRSLRLRLGLVRDQDLLPGNRHRQRQIRLDYVRNRSRNRPHHRGMVGPCRGVTAITGKRRGTSKPDTDALSYGRLHDAESLDTGPADR